MCVCSVVVALLEAEQSKGRRGKSVADIRSLIARKKKLQITHGLPNWGQDLPDDVSHTCMDRS